MTFATTTMKVKKKTGFEYEEYIDLNGRDGEHTPGTRV